MHLSITGNSECACQSQAQITTMMMKRKAFCFWQGGLKHVMGSISIGSGVFSETAHPSCKRFESGISRGEGNCHAGNAAERLSGHRIQAGRDGEDCRRGKNRILGLGSPAKTGCSISRLLSAKLEA
jgi:hypothetical protein